MLPQMFPRSPTNASPPPIGPAGTFGAGVAVVVQRTHAWFVTLANALWHGDSSPLEARTGVAPEDMKLVAEREREFYLCARSEPFAQ